MQGACWTWAMINLVYVWMCACVRMLEKKKRGDKRARALWAFYPDSGCD